MEPQMEKLNFTELLKKLVALRPVSSDIPACNSVVNHLNVLMNQQGLHTAVEDINGRHTLYVSTMPGKKQQILFSSHLDVVPAADEKQFSSYEENGRLYGRGAGDCLGNTMAVLTALIRAKGQYSAAAIFNSDEEIGGNTVPIMLQRGYGAVRSVVVSDHYEEDKITCREKGILNVTLIAHGEGGHAAYLMDPDKNPVDKLAKAYLDLRVAWQNPADRYDWKDSLNGTVLEGSQAVNQVPPTAKVRLNIRYTVPGSVPAILQKIRNAVGDGIEIIHEDVCSPVATDVDSPEVQSFKKSFEAVRPGHDIGFAGMCGATDARHYCALGLPVIICGVKSIGAHGPAEYVELSSIPLFAEIYYQYIISKRHR